jgi:hypothetical protein
MGRSDHRQGREWAGGRFVRRWPVLFFAAMLATATTFYAVADPLPRPSGRAEIAAAQKFNFDIPAQPLLTALEAFGEQAKIQILYDSAVVRNRQSPGVMGEHSQAEALQLLLVGTGLAVSYENARNFILLSVPVVTTQAEAAMPVPQAGAALSLDPLRVEGDSYGSYLYESYAQLVRSSIQRALLAQAGPYLDGRPMRIKVWVGHGGMILRSSIFASSGDSQIDAKVLQIVDGLPMKEVPPAGLPQPIHVRISTKVLF